MYHRLGRAANFDPFFPISNRENQKMYRFSIFAAAMLTTCAAAPVEMKIPQNIDAAAPNIGLPAQPGTRHYKIAAPEVSPTIGWANHDPKMLRVGDRIVVEWTSHPGDENGPGQTIVGTVVQFNPETGEPLNTDSLQYTSLAPAPLPVRRRSWKFDPEKIDEYFSHGGLELHNGRLYTIGRLLAIHGVTDDLSISLNCHHGLPPSASAEHWRDEFDREAGFVHEIVWTFLNYRQRWKIEGNRLVPDTPGYIDKRLPEQQEVTKGRLKKLVSLPEWNRLPLLNNAPADFQADLKSPAETRPALVTRTLPPRCPDGALHIAADGHNGLAHYAEYRRPDGSTVVIRDNLKNPGFYYAAAKKKPGDCYPPAEPTNIPGEAMPSAGNLPDGRAYLIANYDYRRNMYLLLSSDGRTFDTARFVRGVRMRARKGIGKLNRPSGPAYFRSMIVGRKLWIVYSIAKQEIGLTTIDLESL